MYFSKLRRFTKVIRSFSFSIKISLEAQTAPAFMELNSSLFLRLCYAEEACSLTLNMVPRGFVRLDQV